MIVGLGSVEKLASAGTAEVNMSKPQGYVLIIFFMDVAGLVTSLVTKRDQTLAVQLEESMRKGESLEGLTNSREKLEYIKKKEIDEKRKAKAQKLGEKYPKSGKWDVGKSKINSQRGTRGAARTALNSKPSNTSTGGSSRPGRSRNASGIAIKRR